MNEMVVDQSQLITVADDVDDEEVPRPPPSSCSSFHLFLFHLRNLQPLVTFPSSLINNC
jgi:hypothetical protein